VQKSRYDGQWDGPFVRQLEEVGAVLGTGGAGGAKTFTDCGEIVPLPSEVDRGAEAVEGEVRKGEEDLWDVCK
jgi:hypothetical protein